MISSIIKYVESSGISQSWRETVLDLNKTRMERVRVSTSLIDIAKYDNLYHPLDGSEPVLWLVRVKCVINDVDGSMFIYNNHIENGSVTLDEIKNLIDEMIMREKLDII
jgi:hypothetical protein